MAYDPRECGANCDACYLLTRREGGPVPAEINPEAKVIIVAEAPGKTECDFGRPLIGDTGQELQRNISAMGYRRADFSYTNALNCRPPANELSRLIHAWKEENKVRKAKYGKEGMLPSPLACCRPRLYKELMEYENIITLGSAPIQSILQTEQYSISALRGGPITGFLSEKEFAVDEAFAGEGFRPVKILPTFHPSFVLRQRKWTRTLRTDLGRAMRWFQGKLNWVDPTVVIHPTVAQIRAFFEEKVRWNTWDLETTMEDPLIAAIFCFGIGHRHADGSRHAIVIPFHSKEKHDGVDKARIGHPDFYTEAEFKEIVDLLRRWLVAPGRWKVGHNSLIFDSTVVQSTFGVYPKPQHDTLVMHRAVESELPHGLGFIGTTYTDVTAWKADKSGTEAKTDRELHLYNGIDCAVTDDIVEPLAESVKLRDQKEVVKKDYRFLSEACVGMHRLGMKVDVERRDFYDKHFLYQAVKWRNIIREVVNIASFNPGSVQQVKDILFDRWGLPPVEISETTGEPSTGDNCLRQYRISHNLSRQQMQFIEALRRYRNAVKMRGTDVVKYRRFDEKMPPDEFWEDTEETAEEYKERRKRDDEKYGLLLADGRVHSNWNQLTTSGRANSSKPNCFDAQTEVLTRKGWVRFDQLQQGVEVAQWEEGHITFVCPTNYVQREHHGLMLTLRNEHTRLRVTPDHRCLLRHRKTGELQVFLAAEYPEDWQQIHAGAFAGGAGLNLIADEIVVLCAMQADGKWNATKLPSVTFSFAKPRKIVRLKEALDRLGVNYTEGTREPTDPWGKQRQTWIRVGACPLTLRIRELLGEAKVFGWWLLDMSPRELASFCTEIWNWDGCFTRQNHYSSSDQQSAEVVQAALALTGRRAHWRTYRSEASTKDNFQIDVVARDYSLTTNIERQAEETHEVVYCLSVPSSYLLVRREGEIHVTGQCQNKRAKYRDMYIPEPWCPHCKEPHVFVAADMDQLELRFGANWWGLSRYKEVLLAGRDPHAETALGAMGAEARAVLAQAEAWCKEMPERKPKNFANWKRIRDFAKTFYYGVQFGAEDLTVYDILTKAEDDDGNLVYANLDMQTVRERRSSLLTANPELPAGWERDINTWRRQGFLQECVWGRRRDFLNGEEPNEIVNFPVQSGGRAIVMEGEFRAIKAIPYDKWCSKTGLVHDGHDSVMFEVPLSKAEWARNTLQECMQQTVPGHEVPYTSEAHIGINKDPEKGPVGRRSWADV